MSASLLPDRMVCVPCYRCGRGMFIITGVAGQPVAYDGSGFAAAGLSLEESIDRLFDTERDDCGRIESLNATFIVERYWQGQVVGMSIRGNGNHC